MSNPTIRRARINDVPQILAFIRELADYEREPDAVEATESDIEQALFGAGSTTHCLIAETPEGAVGFALYFYNFSTWTGKRGIYLEDLYVTPEARGRGAGKALLVALARKTVEEGCRRFEWSVLNWNTPSIEFYESLGARPMTEWIGYRVDGDALARLAANE